MNRQKKVIQTNKKRLKKEKAKLAPKKKSTYISKAKRAELEAAQAEQAKLDEQTSNDL